MALTRGGTLIQQRSAALGGTGATFRSIWGGPFSFAKSPLSEKRIVATDKKVPVGAAVLQWGKAGTIPTAEEVEVPDPTFANFKVIMAKERYEEKRRTVTEERIENPEDDSQYVDVNRWKEGDFNKSTGDKSAIDKTTTSYAGELFLGTDWIEAPPGVRVTEAKIVLKAERINPNPPS